MAAFFETLFTRQGVALPVALRRLAHTLERVPEA